MIYPKLFSFFMFFPWVFGKTGLLGMKTFAFPLRGFPRPDTGWFKAAKAASASHTAKRLQNLSGGVAEGLKRLISKDIAQATGEQSIEGHGKKTSWFCAYLNLLELFI